MKDPDAKVLPEEYGGTAYCIIFHSHYYIPWNAAMKLPSFTALPDNSQASHREPPRP